MGSHRALASLATAVKLSLAFGVVLVLTLGGGDRFFRPACRGREVSPARALQRHQ